MATESDAIGWFFENREQIVSVWEAFSTVTIGVLGFTALSDKATNWSVAGVLLTGFAIIAVGSGYALFGMYVDLNLSYRLAAQMANAVIDPSLPMAKPISPLQAIVFHAILSIATILAICVRAGKQGARKH